MGSLAVGDPLELVDLGPVLILALFEEFGDF